MSYEREMKLADEHLKRDISKLKSLLLISSKLKYEYEKRIKYAQKCHIAYKKKLYNDNVLKLFVKQRLKDINELGLPKEVLNML